MPHMIDTMNGAAQDRTLVSASAVTSSSLARRRSDCGNDLLRELLVRCRQRDSGGWARVSFCQPAQLLALVAQPAKLNAESNIAHSM